MKLYLSHRAPNPRRVLFFLAEKGIEVPSVMVDLVNKEHWGEDFVRLNPRRMVPVLELDDGTVIAETMAICRYFEALQPDPDLFGRTPKEQGLVEMWQRQVEIDLMQALQFAFRHTHPALAQREVPQVQAWGEANKEKVWAFLTFLDGHLAERAYLALDRFSVADITAIVAVDFMRVLRMKLPEELVHLARWRALVSSRPAAQVGI